MRISIQSVGAALVALVFPAAMFGAAPSISQLQNNYSYVLPGLPNYGIAPGSLFIIKGSGLNNQPISALQSSAPPGLPTLLNGTSLSVTVNGITTTPGIYYTSPTQLAAVLPSSTPVGTGTITVTNNGQPSAPAPIQVVQSALGLDTYYGTGTGLAVATDANYNLLGPTSSATPGQTISLWGSGVGADTTNDDKTYPMTQNNLTGIPMQVFIGGMQASIAYRGRSQYPGVDQVVVTVPQGVSIGCWVSVVAVSGNVVSNSVSIPVAASAGPCSDQTYPASASQILALSGKSKISEGSLGVFPGVGNSASAAFFSYTGLTFWSNFSQGGPSIGSCTARPAVGGTLPTGLDAGSINVSGPFGTQPLTGSAGSYSATLPAGFIPANGGAITFNNGTGGQDVKGFNATITYPASLIWTNMNSISSVVRANGLPITWSSGAPGTYVKITGASTANVGGQQLTVQFICAAPASAGQFTVPSVVLLALPVGSGGLTVQNWTTPESFSATGLDLAYGFAATLPLIDVSYLDSAAALPDLVVTSVTFPASVAAGTSTTFAATVKNQGSAAAGAFRMSFYLSTDSTINTSDNNIGNCTWTSLAAGSSSTCSGSLLVNLPAGTYHGGAIVDDLNQVTESNESNNLLAASNTTTVTAVNSLQGKSFGIDGTITISGSTLNLQITATRNSDGTFSLNADGSNALAPINLIFSVDAATETISGSTATFTGKPDPGDSGYFDFSKNITASVSSVTVSITFASLSTGGTTTGSIAVVTSSGTFTGIFSGTLSDFF